MSEDLGLLPATEVVRLVRDRKLHAVDVMQVHLERIESRNDGLNAIVTLDAEGAMRGAGQTDNAFSGETGCQVDDKPVDWRIQMMAPVSGLPAISVPAGFTSDGLPCGLQVTGRAQDDFGVLQMAYAYESQTNYWKQAPGIISDRSPGDL